MSIDLYKYHSNPEKLKHYDKAYDKVPTLVWEKYELQPEELRKREDVLAKDPKTALMYANYVLKSPFKKGEDAIAKDPSNSVRYARDILKNRFKKGEDAILNSSWADYYKRFLKEKGIEL